MKYLQSLNCNVIGVLRGCGALTFATSQPLASPTINFVRVDGMLKQQNNKTNKIIEYKTKLEGKYYCSAIYSDYGSYKN